MSYARFIGATAVVALASFVVIAVAPAKTVNAQAADTEVSTNQTETPKNPYSYVAQPDDNYSVLARKAVQTMGILDSINLSQAQIVAAETTLTAEAGFPELNQGQAVTFNADSVKKAVDAAQKLDADQQAAWAYYVPFVNFDTRHNGE